MRELDLSEHLTDRDRQLFERSGHGTRAGFGARPVVLVVDVNVNFCGEEPEPILDSIARWPNSCGAEAWEAIGHISRLLDAARANGVPVFYSTAEDLRPDGFGGGRWADKNSRYASDGDHDVAETQRRRARGNEIVPAIAPRPEDVVVRKPKPSAFFGTQFASLLIDLRADSVVVCGTSTSGCVRATVVDGFSHNYAMSVVREATFDRGELSHHMSLFDMEQKYADVVGVEDAIASFGRLPPGLFADRFPAFRSAV